MENFDNYSSFNHLSEDLMYVKRAPNVRFREGYGMAEMSPAVTFTRLQVEQTVGVSPCGMVFVNRDQLMNNAIKPSVQHVVRIDDIKTGETHAAFFGANKNNLLLYVAVANFIGANTEQTLQVEQTVGVSLCGMVFVNRDQLMDNAIKPSVQHVVAVANFIGANTENLLFSFYKRIPSKLQYFG